MDLAGSHRAQRPRRSGRSSQVPPWAVVAAIVVALVPATWFTAQRVFDGPPSATASAPATDLPIPPVSLAPTSSSAPSTSPAPTPAAASSLPTVTADPPRRITAGDALDAGFDSAVTALEASSDDEVARLETRGAPGSPGTDTVVVVGRVLADGQGAFAALPLLGPGDRVTIRTDNGTLTYTVRTAALLARDGLARSEVVAAERPGWLVLVGNRYDDAGDRLGRDLVVTAQLTDATAG